MKVYAILGLLVAVAFAETPRKDQSPSSGEDFILLARRSDRVEIDSPDPAAKELRATLRNGGALEDFVRLFQFSDTPVRGEKVVIAGKEAWIVTPCQCLGDYRLRFFAEGREAITVTFHHEEFIRIEDQKEEAEFDLAPDSGAKIRAELDRLVGKKASQSLQHNAGTAPSADEASHPRGFRTLGAPTR